MTRPVLSLIACSRNDDYLGNALWRLQTGLNLTARAVHELGLQHEVEIILTDWGSDTPLRDVLELTSQAAALLTVLDVPRPTAERYQRDAPFSEVHALNAAARRARGQYIGRIDQDTVLGRHFLRTFFALHRGEMASPVPLEQAVMLSNRRGVPFRFASQRPTARCVERFITLFGRRLPLARPLPEALYYQSYVGIWLIHRDLWHAIGGYDESFIYINWMEADMILRLEPTNPFVNLGRLVDHDIYHLDHIHPLAHWGARGRVRRENPARDREHPPGAVFPNSTDWGLANEPLEMRPYVPRPGESERAQQALRNPAHGRFVIALARFAGRWLVDRSLLATLRVIMAVPRFVLRMVPGLREPWNDYRDTVRGHSIGQWPRRLVERRELRHRSRRAP